MQSSLTALAELILQNAQLLDAKCARRGVQAPSLDEVFVAGSDIPQDDPNVQSASAIIHVAAQQLLHTIRPPSVSLLFAAAASVLPAAMRCASELHITEILKDASPDGLHVRDIANQCNADPQKIAPILRCLASNWIFKEVKPDVFANNRLSSVLDKGQSAIELQQSPENKYTKPEAALSASVELYGDEVAKCSSYLFESISDPATAFSSDANKCAMGKAFNTDKTTWELYEEPGQEARLRRFGVAMEGVKKRDPPGIGVKAFEWGRLPEGGLVVDVGGGFGAMSVEIAQAFPLLKIIVQEMPSVVAEGNKRWERLEPGILASGRVSFKAHSFFDPQPIKNPSVFFMKHIIHDWADSYALQILRNLRDAASDETMLFVMDKIVPHTCLASADDRDDGTSVPGALKPELPGLITNVSGGNNYPHTASLVMMMCNNGQERTLRHTVKLFRDGGWKVVKVHQFDALGQVSSGIQAVPI